MNKIAIYINLFLALVSFLLIANAILKAWNIETDIRGNDKSYQYIDDMFLYRIVVRIVLCMILIKDILCLIVCTNRLYPVLIPYQTNLITYASMLFFVVDFTKCFIIYLIFSKSDFKFFKISKKNN